MEDLSYVSTGQLQQTVLGGIAFLMDERYTPYELLGKGSSGLVAAARDARRRKKDGAFYEVAVKKISRISANASYSARVLREIKVLQHFAQYPHENILHLRDLSINLTPGSDDFDELYFVTDLMEADLGSVLNLNKKITEDHVKYLTYQMLKGLWALHSADIMHRDLKPQNLLVNGNCDLKICDFGLARACSLAPDLPDEPFTEYVITRWYRAPEVLLESRGYSKPVDVWSAGCVIAEMFLGRVFIRGDNNLDQLSRTFAVFGTPDEACLANIHNSTACKYVRSLKAIRKTPLRHIFPASVSDCAVDLLEKMLDMNPSTRYTVDQCLQHPFVAEYFEPHDLIIRTSIFDMSYEQRYLRSRPRVSGSSPAVRNDEVSMATVKALLLEEMRISKALQEKARRASAMPSTSLVQCLSPRLMSHHIDGMEAYSDKYSPPLMPHITQIVTDSDMSG
eukprot:GILI01001379.1.p1 GENE.GILI01001379.1~~GILI01001379.1.p1  ORF type:complete len:451 (+),score=44.49 GILI01001379.1:213-1565(+)